MVDEQDVNAGVPGANIGPDAQGAQAVDDNLVLDLTETDDSIPKYEALPAGIYNCNVEEYELGPSSTGNPMITWRFTVIDPAFSGRLLFYHTVLNKEAGKARLKRLITRIAPETDLAKLDIKKLCDEGTFVGLPCRVKIKIERYQNERRNRVTDVMAPEATDFIGEVQ